MGQDRGALERSDRCAALSAQKGRFEGDRPKPQYWCRYNDFRLSAHGALRYISLVSWCGGSGSPLQYES